MSTQPIVIFFGAGKCGSTALMTMMSRLFATNFYYTDNCFAKSGMKEKAHEDLENSTRPVLFHTHERSHWLWDAVKNIHDREIIVFTLYREPSSFFISHTFQQIMADRFGQRVKEVACKHDFINDDMLSLCDVFEANIHVLEAQFRVLQFGLVANTLIDITKPGTLMPLGEGNYVAHRTMWTLFVLRTETWNENQNFFLRLRKWCKFDAARPQRVHETSSKKCAVAYNHCQSGLKFVPALEQWLRTRYSVYDMLQIRMLRQCSAQECLQPSRFIIGSRITNDFVGGIDMPSTQVRFVLTKRLVRGIEREEESDALSEQVVDTLVELFLRNSLGIFDIREKIRTGKTKTIDVPVPKLTEREHELENTLRSLYREYFNREVDACGFSSYFPQLCSGLLTPLELRRILETSDEYRQLLQQKNK